MWLQICPGWVSWVRDTLSLRCVCTGLGNGTDSCLPYHKSTYTLQGIQVNSC